VHWNVILDALGHQAVHGPACRDHEMQRSGATRLFFECPLHRLDLATDPPHPV
jgi:hypothetical protein